MVPPAPPTARSVIGLLDFGAQGPTWTNPIDANLSDAGNGKLEVSCNPSLTGFTVTIDGGA